MYCTMRYSCAKASENNLSAKNYQCSNSAMTKLLWSLRDAVDASLLVVFVYLRWALKLSHIVG